MIDTAIKLVSAFIKAMGEKLPDLIPTIIEGLLGVLDAIVENIDIMIEAGLKLIDGLIKGLIEALPKLIQKIPEIIQKLVTGLLENLPTIINTVTEMIIEIINFITNPDNLLMIVETAITFITTLTTALLENLPTIIEAVINMFVTVIERLTDPDNIEKMIETAIELITKMAEALVTNVPIIIEKLPAIIEALVNGFITLSSRMGEVAWVLISKLGEGLGLNVGNLGESIHNVFTWVKDTMTNAFLKIKEVGANIIKGLWDGINSMKDWVMNKIRELCRRMLDTIKSFFGIESPSRVMANEVGKYMAQGIGVGFGNTMPSVISAMKEKLAGVTDAFQTTIDIGEIPQIQGNQVISENQYITRNYTNTLETIRQPQTVELTLDGTKVARALIPSLDSEYNRLGVKI